MRAILTALSLLACGIAAAAETRTLAVVSLIGDQFSIVQREPATGSRVRRSQHQAMKFEAPVIDQVALTTADDALAPLALASPARLVAMRDAPVLAAQDRMLDQGGDLKELVDAVRSALGEKKPTHVVLIAKFRGDAMIPFTNSNVGEGRLDGVGFYLDGTIQSVSGQYREEGRGIIAPFAYFQVVFIDLASGQVLRKEIATAAFARANNRSETITPWEIMTAKEKIEALQGLVGRETSRMVTNLLKQP